MKTTRLKKIISASMLALPLVLFSAYSQADDDDERYSDSKKNKISYSKNKTTYFDIIRISRNKGIKGKLAPQMRITSPLNNGIVAQGESSVNAGSFNGSGFAINLEVFTRDEVSVLVNEATQAPGDPGIRNVDQLGNLNPEFPGLFVFINEDLITPDGEIIPKNTNLASLFNVAGSDDTPGKGVTVWAGWHLLESFPADVSKFTITAAVRDVKGRIGFDQVEVNVNAELSSGNSLTPDPTSFPGHGEINQDGPKVEIVAPRVPSSIAVGEQIALPTAQTGSFNFIQVNILDVAKAGIAVDELGDSVTRPEFGAGSILDPLQLGQGDNRNFPGLVFTFDTPLQAPNGVLVPAGGNLAPVFNVVGSEVDTETGAVRVVADWVVGGSLILAEGQDTVTFTATVTDNKGNAGSSKRVFRVSQVVGGQLLTAAP